MGVAVKTFFGCMTLKQGAMVAAICTAVAAVILIAVAADDLDKVRNTEKILGNAFHGPAQDLVDKYLAKRKASDAMYVITGTLAAIITILLILGILKSHVTATKLWVYGCICAIILAFIGAVIGLTIELYAHIATIIFIPFFIYLCVVVYSYHDLLRRPPSPQHVVKA